jgi:hypothetical protein
MIFIKHKYDSKRKDYIKVDPWDSWSGDKVIAMVAAPIIKQLIETKQGAPFVDNDDVPEVLHMTQEDYLEFQEDGSADGNFHKRFDFVLGEMYWALNEIANDCPEYLTYFDDSEVDENEPIMTQVKKVKLDKEGLNRYDKRMKNGLRLFGKYFQSLWD